MTEQAYCRWKERLGGLCTDQLQELTRLRHEKEHLYRALSHMTLNKLILAEAGKENF